jgi:hypothetical protein
MDVDITMTTPQKEDVQRNMSDDPMEEDTLEQPLTKKQRMDPEVEREISKLKQVEKFVFEKIVVSIIHILKFSDSQGTTKSYVVKLQRKSQLLRRSMMFLQRWN